MDRVDEMDWHRDQKSSNIQKRCRYNDSPPRARPISKKTGDFMSTTPSASPQPAPGGPAAAPAKTGSGAKVFLWIFGGCLGIVVIGIVCFAAFSFFVVHKVNQYGDLAKKNPVLAATKLMVAMNPDLE